MILDVQILPEQLSRMIRTEKVQVRESDDGVICLMPIKESVAEKLDSIDQLFGMTANGNLSVDKFIAMTHDGTEIS